MEIVLLIIFQIINILITKYIRKKLDEAPLLIVLTISYGINLIILLLTSLNNITTNDILLFMLLELFYSIINFIYLKINDNKKLKNILITIFVIFIIILAILNYPFIVKVKNNETICYDLLGHTHKCYEQSYP